MVNFILFIITFLTDHFFNRTASLHLPYTSYARCTSVETKGSRGQQQRLQGEKVGDELGGRPRLRAVFNGKVSQRAVMGRDGSLSWWILA